MSLTVEQKARRRLGIGASEIATVVGVGPGRLVELWERKVNGDPPEAEDDENLARDLGSLLEAPIAEVYAKRTGSFLAQVETLQHPKHPLALCTPDRARFSSESALRAVAFAGPVSSIEALQGAERLVEIKSTGGRYRRDYGEAGGATVPEEKALQATWQLGITGLLVLDMPVLFRSEYGVRLDTFTLTFNESLFELLLDAAGRFWTDHVVSKRPPPPDASDAYSEALGRIHPAASKPHAVADATDEELMMRWAKFAEVERRAGHHKKLTGQELMQRIGDAGGLVSPSLGKLSWTQVRDRISVDWKKAGNAALDLAGLCLQAFDRLSSVGEQLSPENRAQLEARLKAIVPEASKPAGGYRYLRMYPKGPAALELAQLTIALDALGTGENEP